MVGDWTFGRPGLLTIKNKRQEEHKHNEHDGSDDDDDDDDDEGMLTAVES